METKGAAQGNHRAWVDDYEREERQMRTASGGGKFENAPEGVHLAICYRIIDLGTHLNLNYGNRQRKIRIHWELPNALMEDGTPFSINKQYTLSHHEKSNLRKDLESWYGKRFNDADLEDSGGFDPEKLLGRACQLNIIHKESDGTTYANVVTIMPATGDPVPAMANELFFFDLDNFDVTKFESLTDKLRSYINESDERKTFLSEYDTGTGTEADIPF